MENEIIESIEKVLSDLGLKKTKFGIDHPAEMKFGDYACNVAMMGFSQVKDQFKSPRELAERIKEKLAEGDLKKMVSEIKVEGPGFINISIKNEVLISLVDKVLDGNIASEFKGKKVAVEYTDPNPFKEFHIGHLYSNLIGESISKIFEANGARVWRGDFYGDVGMHVAKSVWGMMQLMKNEKVSLGDLEKKSIKERQKFMGQGYALGVNKFEEDEKVKKEIEELNYLVYVAAQDWLKKEKGWKPIVDYQKFIKNKQTEYQKVKEIYQAGLKWSLEYFETYYQRLGTEYDGYYPESWVGEIGMQVVEKGLKMGVLEKSQGAVVYKGEQDGLHTRVFVNKLGLPTYEAKDLGLVKAKHDDFKFDLSINVFGKEIDEYYKVVKKALEKIEPELGKKQTHLAHGMVNLPEGKMSSRTGNVVTVEWLLNESRDRALKIMKDSKVKGRDEAAEIIGQAAVKYAFLKSGIGGNITFDFQTSVSFEGNSGPYLQYTYARCKSVLEKAGKKLPVSNLAELNQEEKVVLKLLSRFGEVVVEAAEELAPNLVANYLYDLAQKYNAFYNRHRILTGENKELRLWLTKATSEVVKKGLALLGIKVLERM